LGESVALWFGAHLWAPNGRRADGDVTDRLHGSTSSRRQRRVARTVTRLQRTVANHRRPSVIGVTGRRPGGCDQTPVDLSGNVPVNSTSTPPTPRGSVYPSRVGLLSAICSRQTDPRAPPRRFGLGGPVERRMPAANGTTVPWHAGDDRRGAVHGRRTSANRPTLPAAETDDEPTPRTPIPAHSPRCRQTRSRTTKTVALTPNARRPRRAGYRLVAGDLSLLTFDGEAMIVEPMIKMLNLPMRGSEPNLAGSKPDCRNHADGYRDISPSQQLLRITGAHFG
jgi:hypothetical protein